MAWFTMPCSENSLAVRLRCASWRDKTTIYVQILTHMREKRRFLQRVTAGLAADLAALEGALSSQRDALAKTKVHADSNFCLTRL
jgi:hypothetical protein